MQKFVIDRKHLKSVQDNIYYENNNLGSYLVISDIRVLSSFMGYLKFQQGPNDDYAIVFRGQTKNYPKMLPSLYRGEKERFSNLEDAIEALNIEIKKRFKSSRFKHENLTNLYQHYGIKSSGVDVVDNIFIALWFALMKLKCLDNKNDIYTFMRSRAPFGWVYFFKTEKLKLSHPFPTFPEHYLADLRENHSSLSMRLHCQHGYMILKCFDPKKGGPIDEYSYDRDIIATVQIPNIDSFLPTGELFSMKYLFPNKKFDNTYKIFLSKKFMTLKAEIENNFSLNKNEIGRILKFKYTT